MPRTSLPFESLQRLTEELLLSSKAQTGYGYTAIVKERATKRYGNQTLPEEVVFEEEHDLLRFLRKEREAERFRQLLLETRSRLPELAQIFSRRPHFVLKHADDWRSLLLVCEYFKENPRPGIFARELPIPVGTKFIEERRRALRELLPLVLPYDLGDGDGRSFEECFGLSFEEPFIRIRSLDPEAWTLPYREIGIGLRDLCERELPGDTVVVVENKRCFLTLPRLPRSFAIWGGGFQASVLAVVPWLSSRRVLYWGDMDAHGFQILSRLRAGLPKVESIMMDEKILDNFSAFVVTGATVNFIPLEHLTLPEAALYERIAVHNLRLEQERIDQDTVKNALTCSLS